MSNPLSQLFWAAVLLVSACNAFGQSTFIPVSGRRDMVFDRAGKYLYISTTNGTVVRYNLLSSQLEGSFNLGGSLNGLDIAADDSFLLVAQNVVSGSQGIIHRVNLINGSLTNITYDRARNEAGALDVAIAANGLALMTTRVPEYYSGNTPVRQIDLATNTTSIRSDIVTRSLHEVSSAQIHRSADRTRLYLLETKRSDGPVYTYDALTNKFEAAVETQMYFDTATAAVDRTGRLLATLVGVQYPFGYSKPRVAIDTAPDLQFLRGFAELDSGMAFDAVADVLYGVSSASGQIIAYDTNTFAERSRLNVGEAMENMVTQFAGGTLVASQDGRFLALATPSGVRLFSVAAATLSPPPTASFKTRQDIIFDHSGQYLYLTTDNGLLQRFQLGAGTMEIVADLGGKLNGADISPDDKFLVVAQDTYGVAQGMWQRVDLSTGAVTNLNYQRRFQEAGAWDVSIGSNGFALATTSTPRGFSSNTPIRQISVATGDLSFRPLTYYFSEPTAGTHICRSADHSRLFFLMPNGSGGGVFTYSAVTDTFGDLGATGSFLDSSSAAVSRDGSLIALRRGYPPAASVDTAPDLDFVQPLPIDGGVAFDAKSDVVYGVDRKRSEVIAFEAYTGSELYRFGIGEDVREPPYTPGGPGPLTPEMGYIKLVSSNDGRYLALETPSGFRLFDLLNVTHTSPPEPLFGLMSGMVFDHAGKYLYITTKTGYVWPYDLEAGKLAPPYHLGGSLAGIDISPDDSYLLVAQQATGVDRGRFEKVALKTGEITRMTYKYGNRSARPWNVAIASNGKGFGTTSDSFLFEIDPANNTTRWRTDFEGYYGPGSLFGLTKIRRSADANTLAFDDGKIFLYTAATDTFGPPSDVASGSRGSVAINRDGSALAVRDYAIKLMTIPGFNVTHASNKLGHAIAFDATKDVLYGVDPVTDHIVGYDTATFEEQVRFAIGEDLPDVDPEELSSGAFASSPNGRYLALQCNGALRLFDLSANTATAVPILPRIGNISTRALIGAGNNVPIAGFIVAGPGSKKVVIRAIGPSLTAHGVSGAVADTILELRDSTGSIIAFNNNWKESEEADISATGLAPTDDLESALVRTLTPGAYTAVVRGNGSTGITVAEVYDLEPNANSKLANISTRGFAGNGEQSMIAGVIVRSVGESATSVGRTVLVRGLGPSLARFGVPNPLSNPAVELYGPNGTRVMSNEDWKIPGGGSYITETGLAPTNDRESAFVVSLAAGNYTAILTGENGASGNGVIEVFSLQ
ncbi:MAG TPA: hypothetical protein VM940_16395 [Chthoniobacterales bacterium]|jgi:hypothetical protein|nr:hypothetical protein [Chthoniobacterales bacterium]